MSLTGLLVSGGDATSHPDPNTLTFKNPYPTPRLSPFKLSDDFIAQGKKVFVLKGKENWGGPAPLGVRFIPSVPDANITATLFIYSFTTESWYQPASNATITFSNVYAEGVSTEIENPPAYTACYFALNVSDGTADVYVDENLAEVL